MFAIFFVSGVDSKTDFPAESSTATLRSRITGHLVVWQGLARGAASQISQNMENVGDDRFRS
jgi:hypothetical protein